MSLHPAFWKSSADENGVVSGRWRGERVHHDPRSAATAPDGLLLPDHGDGDIVAVDQVAESLDIARANLDAVLHEELARVAAAGPAAFTELAHIMLGLPRHAALAASDAPDRPTAEALTKLSIHWTRCAEHWRELVRTVAGTDSSQLQPLPTTMALQLGYEELASQDLAAYLTCVGAFGFPGDQARVSRLAAAAAAMLGANPEASAGLDAWAAQAGSTGDNYASVKSLRAMGSLADTDLYGLAVQAIVPADQRRWRRTMGSIHSAAETTEFFGFGIVHFFRPGGDPWPRLKTSWAGV